MQIGKYKIEIIEAGTFALDGGAMFGIIPKPLWEKTNSADPSNRITLAARLLFLQKGNKKILIDTGYGDKWDQKLRQIYCFNDIANMVESALESKGIRNDKITDVILTHLHFDHTGGSTKISNGKLIPTFPNAKYYVQKKNYDWAMQPSERDRGSYIKDNFTALYDEGVLNFLNGDSFFDDEIELFVVNGHTFGQQLVKISDTSKTLFYCGDLLPLSSHISLPYIMGYDLQPLVTLEEKKKILKQAADENWILFFEHDPYFAAAIIERTEKGYTIKEGLTDFNGK